MNKPKMQLEERILETILKKVLALKPEESFLVIADPPKVQLARQLADYAGKVTSQVLFKIMPELEQNSQEPAPEIAGLMLEYDVQFYWTSKSLSHTQARRNAIGKGHRVISSPNLTFDMANRCIDIDYDVLIELHKKVRPLIVNSREIRITTPLGTSVVTAVHDTHGQSHQILKDKPGSFGNLPVGEIDSGIIREKTNGVIFFDGSFPQIGLLDLPIKVTVKDGSGEISPDSDQARKLQKMLAKVGPDAFKLAELGIGTNPNCKITGIVLEDEKVLGTVHFAFGNDLSYNGTNDVPIHLDGVVKKPTIEVDGILLMKDGKFLV
jgi:leucyl aminopeptidase (aminopeptidase T)